MSVQSLSASVAAAVPWPAECKWCDGRVALKLTCSELSESVVSDPVDVVAADFVL